MTEYRYYSADILTGSLLAELPLYGVWFNRKLSTTGEFTGTLKLGTGQFDDASLLQGTTPGKSAIYVERNGQLIWGGIVWSRTWEEQAKTCSMTGQTFESVFDHVPLLKDFIHQNEDPMTIFKAIIDNVQAQAGNNFGFDTSGITSSGSKVRKEVLVPGYEFHFAQEAIDQLVDADDGFDYTIDILPSNVVDQPQKVIRAGYPKLGLDKEVQTYDYPGNIDNFYWPESATNGATMFVGLGAGSGPVMLKSVQSVAALIDAGYPAWYAVNSYKDITHQSTLSARTAADRDRLSMPVSVPTFELKSDRLPFFTGWNDLGANFTAHIESMRFPGGKDIVSRMVGWELQVADSENDEVVKLAIEGEDDSNA